MPISSSTRARLATQLDVADTFLDGLNAALITPRPPSAPNGSIMCTGLVG
jgi:hypothetical protein